MNKMNKYDIDEQFLNKGWAKMKQRLDSELPLQAPWYINKIWYIAALAASIVLFTSYQCYKLKNVKSSAENITPFKQNFEKAINSTDKVENNSIALDRTNNTKLKIDNNIGDNTAVLAAKSEEVNNKILKVSETNTYSKPILNFLKTTVVKEVNEQHKKHLNKNKNIKIKHKTDAYKQVNNSPQQEIITTSNTSIEKAAIINTNDHVKINENIISTDSDLNKYNSSYISPIIENEQLVSSANNTIGFLPLIASQLSNDATVFQLARLENDIPNSKIWQYKKPLTFGLVLGINTNIKDASGVRAGLFANYQLTNKLILGTSIAFAYTATNTNYNVRYNVPVPINEDDPVEVTTIPPEEAVMQRAIVEEVLYNTNQKGLNAKLMLSYYPVERLGIAGGLFATRYVLNNASFDFLKSNDAYSDRALSSNYAYNSQKAGPAFELQYWVKPKLNVAATFEMNLIPAVKQEFWATTKQDYLRNSFGIALQYQFN